MAAARLGNHWATDDNTVTVVPVIQVIEKLSCAGTEFPSGVAAASGPELLRLRVSLAALETEARRRSD